MSHNGSISVSEVKNAARGRWQEVLERVAGIPRDLLDGEHHPCPKCGGVDRFRQVDRDAGAVLCNKCFAERNGDGLAAVQWALDCTFPEAVKTCAAYLGLANHEETGPAEVDVRGDLIDQICAAKRIPKGAFLRLGAKLAKHGKLTVCRLPMFDAEGVECSEFDIALIDERWSKGLCKGGAPAGLFLADPWPRPGRTLVVTEGAKDTAALLSLGYDAVGLPTCTIPRKLLPWFTGCDVVLVPDLDRGGIEGARKSAKKLAGIAASVRIARLPGEIVESHGQGVREVLARPEGEALVRAAIAGAGPFRPGRRHEQATGELHGDELDQEPGSTISNFATVETETGRTTIPTPLPEITAAIRAALGDFPRRVGTALFVPDASGNDIRWLERTADLSALVRRHFRRVIWKKSGSCATFDELTADLRANATAYKAVEDLPHWPEMPGTYYTCSTPQPGDGKALAWLLGRFNPATEIDGDLIKAAFLTVLWGGAGGTRPAFVVTADEGRGCGKSALAEMVAHLAGGLLTFSSNEQIADIKARLLSPEALPRRVCLLDNIKSHRFSWAEMEALVTAPVISGRRLYVGEGSRPNTLLWLLTLNGASLSTDMAQRCVIIKLQKPQRSASWAEDTRAFVLANRQAIIGDCIAELRRPAADLARYSRWASWERDVLSKLPEPEEAQRVIAERQEAADVDLDEAGQIEEHFREQLEGLGYDVELERILIPTGIAAHWLAEVTGQKVSAVAAGRLLNQLCTEGRMRSLQVNNCRTYGRGFLFIGATWNADGFTRTDVATRVEERRNGRLNGYSRAL